MRLRAPPFSAMPYFADGRDRRAAANGWQEKAPTEVEAKVERIANPKGNRVTRVCEIIKPSIAMDVFDFGQGLACKG